jgi:hypothetical protein
MAIVRVTVAEGNPDELVQVYERISAKMRFAEGQGPRVHVAMKTPTGIRVANIWASETEADAARGRLEQVVQEEGLDLSAAKIEQYELINATVDGKPVSL